MNVRLKEYEPVDLFKPFIEFFWEGEFNWQRMSRLQQRVIPNGYVELIIHLSDLHCDLCQGNTWGQSPDYTIIGLYTTPYDVHFSNHVSVFGIRFKPEGFYNIFGVPASEFSGKFEDMEDIAGTAFREFCEKLRDSQTISRRLIIAEQYILRNLEKMKLNMDYVNRAAEIIRQEKGFIRIEDLSGQVFISIRQLEREFKRKVGISPKLYMRIARLNEVHRQLEQHDKLDFTAVTYACGYSDQAHFIRDFKNLTGEKPSLFVKNRHQYIVNPRMADPARFVSLRKD
ncbi:MAG: AraC family transcriptional regulator [Cyclobacteriaceae bacterium]|nr:AraC family transcriptional regulator [Cyclobacteriaceae bacterium]